MIWYTHATCYISGAFRQNVSFSIVDGKFDKIIVPGDKNLETGTYPETGAYPHAAMPPGDSISLNNAYVVPGFIDQHIHGSVGCDFMDGSVEGNLKIAAYLPQIGVTSFVATTLTEEPAIIQAAIRNLNTAFAGVTYEGAQCLGIHLEGPFINTGRKGAHEIRWIAPLTVESYEGLVGTSHLPIKIVTLAPECDENHALIKHLSALDIVPSAGHSAAKYSQMQEAVKHGVKCVTHCYNAMSSITARDGGVVGAALTIPGLSVELISDGIHVTPENIELYHRMIPLDERILISDAMRARGSKAGNVALGNLQATYDGTKVVLGDGTLAGSALKQFDAVHHYMKVTGVSFEDVIPMLTENPANLLKIQSRKGKIQQDLDADFIVLDHAHTLLMTVCRGQICYRREDEDNCCTR